MLGGCLSDGAIRLSGLLMIFFAEPRHLACSLCMIQYLAVGVFDRMALLRGIVA